MIGPRTELNVLDQVVRGWGLRAVNPVVDAASWKIASELSRRSPGLVIRASHPGGGQYDCLSLHHHELGHVADINREGSFHVVRRLDDRATTGSSWRIWSEVITLDSRRLVDQASHRIGQRVPAKLPPTTRRVLVYRLIAFIVGMNAFSGKRWTCSSGVHDSSGMEGSSIDPSFGRDRSLQPRLRILVHLTQRQSRSVPMRGRSRVVSASDVFRPILPLRSAQAALAARVGAPR